MPALPNTERAVLGLDIVGRIPVGVKHHDFIGSRYNSREIETQTTSARGEEKDKCFSSAVERLACRQAL
jgi:hypothetical protein